MKRLLLIPFLVLVFGCPKASAQVPVALSPIGKMQFFSQNGTVLSGGRVCTYAAGTTTPLATYTDSTGTSVNSNPIILDSAGRANIWLSGSAYKFQVAGGGSCASPSNLQWTVDNIRIGVFASGNNIFTGNNIFNGTSTFNGTIATNAGGTLNGTFGGNPTLSGTVTFSGATNHAGLATFNGGLKTDTITGITATGATNLAISGIAGSGAIGQPLVMRGGNGAANFAGGFASLSGGAGTGNGVGGGLFLASGSGGALNGAGGAITIGSGAGGGFGSGGNVTIAAAGATTGGVGGTVLIRSGATDGGVGAPINIFAGDALLGSAGSTGSSVNIQGGNGPILSAGTGGNIILTPGTGITANGTLRVNTGVSPGGGTGIKHARITTGSLGAGTWTEVVITWAGTAFGSTNYTPVCSVVEATTAGNAQGLVLERIITKSTTQVGAVIQNPTGGDITGVLDCIAFHDGN